MESFNAEDLGPFSGTWGACACCMVLESVGGPTHESAATRVCDAIFFYGLLHQHSHLIAQIGAQWPLTPIAVFVLCDGHTKFERTSSPGHYDNTKVVSGLILKELLIFITLI